MSDFESMFDSNYLRWFHLPETGLLVEIVRVDPKVEMQLPGQREKQYKPVLHYKVVAGEVDKPRPLVLNKTNAKLIASICGRDVSKWIGSQVVFYQSETRLGREKVQCVRVRSKSNG